MSSPAKTWTIVCFTADESVEAVPTKWINGDECLWPVVTREKLNSHIRKCDFNSCWPSHKVWTFRNATYDDYAVARSKASKAENTSDLNTDDGGCYGQPDNLGKRIRRKKMFSSSESEDDESHLGVSAEKRRRIIKKITAPPTWMETVDVTNIENNYGDNILEDTVSQPQPSTSVNKSPEITSADLKRAPEQIITDSLKNMCKSKNKANTGGCCCNPQLLYNIQSLLIEINAKVDKFCGKNNEIEIRSNILEKSKLNFPICTSEDLNVFENFLLTPENYSALVLFFANLGGINLYEFIRRCLAPIMQDILCEQFSFLGKKGKITFKNTSIAKAIIEAAQKAGHSHNFKETEQRIGDWLRRAKERRLRVEQKNKVK